MMMRCRISHRDCYIHCVISVTIGDGACSTSPRPPWGRSSVPAVANLQGPLWLMFVARCGRSLGPAVADFRCPSWPPVADLHGPPWLIYETHRGRSSGITMVDLWGPQWPIIETRHLAMQCGCGGAMRCDRLTFYGVSFDGSVALLSVPEMSRVSIPWCNSRLLHERMLLQLPLHVRSTGRLHLYREHGCVL